MPKVCPTRLDKTSPNSTFHTRRISQVAVTARKWAGGKSELDD
jgi:hypothetical protein